MRQTTFLIIALSAICGLAPLAINMYLPSLPTMAESLGGSIDQMEATVSIFLLGYAVSQLVLGPLSDRFGRRPVLLGGLTLFAVASILCALANSPSQLYLFRFLQAFGGGASVTVFALVRDKYTAQKSAQIISYIMAAVVIAPLLAPILGGYLLIWSGWRSIFIALMVFALLTIVLTFLFVRDVPNAGKEKGEPLSQAYKTVLTNGRALTHMLIGAFAFSGLFAFVAGSPFVYIKYFGVAPQNYGYFVGINAAAMISANLINARLGNIAPTKKMIIGACGIALASVYLLLVNAGGGGLYALVAGVVFFVGMLGFIAANAIAGALAPFDQEAGTASAISGVLQFGFGAVSSALISGWTATNATLMIVVMAGCGLLAFAFAMLLLLMPKKLVYENSLDNTNKAKGDGMNDL